MWCNVPYQNLSKSVEEVWVLLLADRHIKSYKVGSISFFVLKRTKSGCHRNRV